MEEKKEYQEFCCQMKKAVQECFSKEVHIEIHKIVKNNSLELDSLVILEEGRPMSPNFYLQAYYEEYRNGTSVKILAKQMKKLYTEAVRRGERMEFDLSYENCIKHIIFRLVSLEKNKMLFQTVPYVPFMDMAVMFYLLIRKDEEGICSIRINHKLLKEWKIDIGDLFALAKENTKRLFPERICSMYSLMDAIEGSEEGNMLDGKLPQGSIKHIYPGEPFVITNDSGINGAAVILYPDTLKNVAKILQGDFYLLPSSIHEVLAIPVHAAMKEQDLCDMVWEVNRTCVAKEEILSGSVYRYDQDTETLKICR